MLGSYSSRSTTSPALQIQHILCMYLYVHVHVCMQCVHVRTCVYTVYACTCVCCVCIMYVCVYMCTHVCMYPCVHNMYMVDIRTCAYAEPCVHQTLPNPQSIHTHIPEYSHPSKTPPYSCTPVHCRTADRKTPNHALVFSYLLQQNSRFRT